jgi:hypothetical protein
MTANASNAAPAPRRLDIGHERYCHVYVNAGCTCNALQRAAFRYARKAITDHLVTSKFGATLDLSAFTEAHQHEIRKAIDRLAERIAASPID